MGAPRQHTNPRLTQWGRRKDLDLIWEQTNSLQMEFRSSKARITYQQKKRPIHVVMDLHSTPARQRGGRRVGFLRRVRQREESTRGVGAEAAQDLGIRGAGVERWCEWRGNGVSTPYSPNHNAGSDRQRRLRQSVVFLFFLLFSNNRTANSPSNAQLCDLILRKAFITTNLKFSRYIYFL